MPPYVAPMLARSGPPASFDGWVAEPKLDGWRVCVNVGDTATVHTRSGRTIAVPEFDPLLELGLEMVLDGELISDAGRSRDFYAVAPAVARRRRGDTLALACFDLVWLSGCSLVDLPYRHRRRLLEQLPLAGPVAAVASFPGEDAPLLLESCAHLGVEGLVLKEAGSRYTEGLRSSAWRKVECDGWRSDHGPRRRPAAARS